MAGVNRVEDLPGVDTLRMVAGVLMNTMGMVCWSTLGVVVVRSEEYAILEALIRAGGGVGVLTLGEGLTFVTGVGVIV